MANYKRIIIVTNAFKHYKNSEGGFFALFDVSVEIVEGSFNVILGESGSGKTTLLKLLSGLIFPSKGEVTFEGSDLNTMNNSQLAEIRRNNFGFVFPEVGLLEHLNCNENIQFPELEFKSTKVDELAKYFGISHCMNKFPNQVSLGEKQRVTLARALYKKPEILIADEPTANLDWKNAKRSIELIKKYSSGGKTIILATHDERILEFATNIIRLNRGKIVEIIKKN